MTADLQGTLEFLKHVDQSEVFESIAGMDIEQRQVLLEWSQEEPTQKQLLRTWTQTLVALLPASANSLRLALKSKDSNVVFSALCSISESGNQIDNAELTDLLLQISARKLNHEILWMLVGAVAVGFSDAESSRGMKALLMLTNAADIRAMLHHRADLTIDADRKKLIHEILL